MFQSKVISEYIFLYFFLEKILAYLTGIKLIFFINFGETGVLTILKLLSLHLSGSPLSSQQCYRLLSIKIFPGFCYVYSPSFTF